MKRLIPIVTVVAVVLLAGLLLLQNTDGDGAAATAPPTSDVPSTTIPPRPGSSVDASVEDTAPPSTEAPDPTVTTIPLIEGEVDLPTPLAAVVEPWPTDWSRRTIEFDELLIGLNFIDPRDVIRPLDSPPHEPIAAADQWLVDREIGVMLEIAGSARFFPLRILTAHEIVNDEINGVPYAVTYCPLCNTAIAFDRRFEGATLRLGVSGLLRNSDLVMWDDLTVSLWQQVTGEGIVGAHAGKQLTILPTATLTWADFKAAHPAGEVLSQDTGFGFNYGSNSYAGYSNRNGPLEQFFNASVDRRFPALSRVVGVRVDDAAKAYPFSMISEPRVVNDTVGGQPIAVWWAPTDAADNFSGRVVGEGEAIGTGIAFNRVVDGRQLTFNPAGETEFVDAETGSIWNHLGKAITGPLAGTQLELALHQNEFWFAWAAFNDGAPIYGL